MAELFPAQESNQVVGDIFVAYRDNHVRASLVAAMYAELTEIKGFEHDVAIKAIESEQDLPAGRLTFWLEASQRLVQPSS